MQKFLLLFFALFAMTFYAKAQVPVLTEDFEGSTIPSGWTTIDADNDGSNWEHSSVQEEIGGYNSNGSVVSHSYDNNTYDALFPDNWLISPAINLSGTSSLSFWFVVAQAYPADHFGVYISTTSATDTSAFTSIFDYTPTSVNGTWTQQTIDLTSYAGNTVYIAFRHFDCTDQFLLALDDIVVYSGTTETMLTVNPSTVNFGMVNPNDHSTVASVVVTGYNTTAAISATVSTPFEISDNNTTNFGSSVTLPAAGDTLYVRYSPTTEGTDNGTVTLTSGTATASISLTGTAIDCNVTIPYTETFESTSSYLNCWTMSGDASWSIGTGDYSSSTGAYAGDHNALITHSSTGNVTKLISPFLDGADNGLALTFAYVMRSWSGDIDELRIYSRTSANSAWQQVAEYTDAASTWTLETVFISGSVYQIAFEFTDRYGYGLGIDNVTFTPMSTDFCYPVTNLTASNITAHEATLIWSGNANNYTIYNLADSSIVATVNDTTYNLTNLTSDSQHSFGVVANCTGSNSDMVIVNLHTQISCPVPTGLAVVLTPGDGTVATLNWNENGTATAWQICLNGDETNLIDVTDTTFDFTNLTPEQAYTVKVRANCDADDQSSWSNLITFTPTNAYSITVNEGTNTNSYVPVYGLYVDELTQSQFIIPAADLTVMLYSTINKLTFYASQANVNWGAATFNVYVTETNETTLAALVDYSSMTQVYTGSLSIVNNTMEVNFTTPYLYMGGNLMIGFDQTLEGNYASSNWYGVSATGASMGGYNSSVSQRNFLPKTNIAYTPGSAPSCLPVNDLTVDTITTNSVTLSWTGTAANYDIYNDTILVGNTTNTTYTITGLNAATAYTFGVQAVCSSTDISIMRTISATTECADITTLPYNEGFENDLGCWTTINGSSDGMPWNVIDNATYAHSGSKAAVSLSYNSGAIHANAWLISPKFVLPNVSNDSLSFSWWHRVSSYYPTELYDVKISTTTNDTAAFTATLLSVSPDSVDEYVHNMVDLTPYAGQEVYIAFHHHDSYDQNYLLIDDIALFQGGYVPPAPDTLTVTFEVDDATMGTTIPAPGTYLYLDGDTIYFGSQANAGFHFLKWEITLGGQTQEFGPQYANGYYVLASSWMQYETVVFKAFFEAGLPDSTTITYAVNDPTMGTITPSPGTYTIYVGDAITATATPNNGYVLSAWLFDIYISGTLYSRDTILSTDAEFDNPMNFGSLPQTFADYDATITITAVFEMGSTPVTQYIVTLNTADATMGTVSPAGANTVNEGSSFTATATALDGYHFVNWTDNNGNTFTTNPYTFTVNSNTTLTATFEANDPVVTYFNVTVTSADPNMGNVSSTHSGPVAENTVVTVTAIANTGYRFVNWTNDAGTEVSTNNEYTFTVTADIALIANFELEDGINDIDASNVLIYANNSTIYVRGAEGHDVFVYDMNGRCIYQHANAIETETISMSSAGIYMVRIDNAIFKKVVIVK